MYHKFVIPEEEEQDFRFFGKAKTLPEYEGVFLLLTHILHLLITFGVLGNLDL